jgi:hypothetical protein
VGEPDGQRQRRGKHRKSSLHLVGPPSERFRPIYLWRADACTTGVARKVSRSSSISLKITVQVIVHLGG